MPTTSATATSVGSSSVLGVLQQFSGLANSSGIGIASGVAAIIITPSGALDVVDDVQLPEDVERGAKGGPKFQTTILSGYGGSEQRNIDWQFRRAEYTIGYGLQDPSGSIKSIINLFHAQFGKAYAFLFKDWSDYTIVAQSLGTGDGVTTDFQIIKTYSTSARSYNRTIRHPKSATLSVAVNNVGTSAYTLQPSGIIRFTSAPPLGHSVTLVYGEFFVPVRFDIDHLEVTVENLIASQVDGIKLVEVLE